VLRERDDLHEQQSASTRIDATPVKDVATLAAAAAPDLRARFAGLSSRLNR